MDSVKKCGFCGGWGNDCDCPGSRIAALEQKCAELERERDAEKDRAQHTQEWYATRWRRLKEWARKDIPDNLSNQFFSIIANGTKDPFEPPTYAQQMNVLKHHLERAVRKLSTSRKQAQELQAVWSSMIGDGSDVLTPVGLKTLIEDYREELRQALRADARHQRHGEQQSAGKAPQVRHIVDVQTLMHHQVAPPHGKSNVQVDGGKVDHRGAQEKKPSAEQKMYGCEG